MANPEHVRIVKEGVEKLSSFRQENPVVELDLREADLFRANLSGADLSGADLRWANLGGAKGLDPATLAEVVLVRARGLSPELKKQILKELEQSWEAADSVAQPTAP